MIGSALLLASLIAAAAWMMSRRPAPAQDLSVRLTFSPPEGATLADLATAGPVTISPDGRRLAFIARGADNKRLLWVRELESTDARPLPGTDGAAYPFWSPDSRLIAFFASEDLKKISADGGPPQTICPATQPRGGTWNEDGVIVFSGNAGNQLYRVSDNGGSAVALPWRDANNEKLWPSFLPDGRHLVYFARPAKPGSTWDRSIHRTHHSWHLHSVALPTYLATCCCCRRAQRAVLPRRLRLIARPFDADSLQFTGEAVPIADQVEYRTLWGRGGFSASNNGILVTARDTLRAEMAWFDRRGQRLETVRVLPPSANSRWPELSPDDTMLATTDVDPVVQTTDIHVFDLARGKGARLTSNPALDSKPRWSPDGKSHRVRLGARQPASQRVQDVRNRNRA